MKIFLDTANLDEIKKAASWGVIDGITTNPTLVAKEKKDFKQLIKNISQVVPGPISAEVIGMETEKMVIEARELAAIAPQVVIKVPMNPEGLKATKILKEEGINTNVTLVFSANQALLAAKAGAAFVSPFLGRLDDIGFDGTSLVEEIVEIFYNYDIDTEVIAASIRHPLHVTQVAKLGSHIATVPFKVLQQMFKHPLTDLGIERFLQDWEEAQAK